MLLKISRPETELARRYFAAHHEIPHVLARLGPSSPRVTLISWHVATMTSINRHSGCHQKI